MTNGIKDITINDITNGKDKNCVSYKNIFLKADTIFPKFVYGSKNLKPIAHPANNAPKTKAQMVYLVL